MRVVLAHDFACNSRALHGGTIRKGTKVVHPPKDSPMNRLQAIARVGKCTRNDDGHGVIEEGAFHLLLDLDWLNSAEGCRRCVT
ncbi:unannotated protein [freshwater metagenome]|uniref:Unannotated protein n=1 Tax=freshwater metagenome TaxID=449393 RepID=A0A6J6DPW6_9ZZZZ